MNLTREELNLEIKYLENTEKVTKQIITKKEKQLIGLKNDIVKRKRHLWQNKNEYSNVETFSTMDEEDLNTSIVNESQKKITKLYRSLFSPYFGRVSLEDGEKIYIGLTGIEYCEKNYVYDWRAPIANLYYNYDTGSAKYRTPNGDLDVCIVGKRQYKIESGKLIDAFNTDITIDDELLQSALLANNTDKMKTIVSTIQKEQNEVIRYNRKRNLIIEGIAGSGKTSVAMHRIAYILYNQKNITNKNILIISPSTAFTNYISNVLPDLGEEEVPTISIDEFISKYIPFSKISDKTVKEDLETFERNYHEKIDKLLLDYFEKLNFKSKLGLKKKFITSDELNQIFKKKNNLTSIGDRINYTVEKICDLYDISYEKNYEKLSLNIKKMLAIPNDPIDLYRIVTGKSIKTNMDYLVCLYINFEVNGYPLLAHVKHVVIDEVQDYPYLLLEILRRTFNVAQFTLLGDVYQSTNGYFRYSNLSDIGSIFKESDYIKLDKTYRSSYEIIDYTNKILDIKNITSVRKPNGCPVLEKSGGLLEVKREMDRLSKKYNRIALIVKDELLDECAHLCDKDTDFITSDNLKSRLIVPVSTIKGLEFDAVIIYMDKNTKFSENEKNLFYVSATRAVHELVVFNK